jgi:hypothetical protein
VGIFAPKGALVQDRVASSWIGKFASELIECWGPPDYTVEHVPGFHAYEEVSAIAYVGTPGKTWTDSSGKIRFTEPTGSFYSQIAFVFYTEGIVDRIFDYEIRHL